jgi:UDP-glucose 4-epimerase
MTLHARTTHSVTGGAGFIGSNLANHLAKANEVIAIDDGYLGTAHNFTKAVEFHQRSVLEDDLPTDVDVVFHLAALSSYAMHEENPTNGVRVNVEGFVNTVEHVREKGVILWSTQRCPQFIAAE